MNTPLISDSFATRALGVMTILSLILSTFSAYTAHAVDQGEYPLNPEVVICHATDDHGSPYGSDSQEVDAAEIILSGHDSHDGPIWFSGINEAWGDIIPPFEYNLGEGTSTYPGKNWDNGGDIVLENDCQFPEPETATFDLEKKISGPAPFGYTADQFKFLISGIADPIELTAFTDDSANATVELPVGEYTLSEIGPDGFVEEDWVIQWTGAGCESMTGPSTNIVVEERHLDWQNFGCRADNQWKPDTTATGTVSINGHKWHDDGDGVWESEESTLPGWTIVLTDADGNTLKSTTTNEHGEYWFTDLIPGEYGVCEVLQSNWTQTAPAGDGCYDLTLSAGEVAEDVNFGNMEEDNSSESCIVEGYKYDAQGVPLSGWEIGLSGEFYSYYSVARGTSSDSTTEVYTDLTDSTGYYCIPEYRGDEEVFGTNYHVGEVLQDGWSFVTATVDGVTTTPTFGDSFFDVWVDVDLPSVGETRVVNFYNESDGTGGDEDTYIIEGYVWHDDNENAVWDGFLNEEATTTEEELSGWTVMITNGSSTYSTTTDESGFYSFEVPAGTWTITQVLQEGWTLITPASGSHVITVPEVVARSFTERVFAWILPTAHAAVQGTFGPFDFGNNETANNNGGGGGGGGGGSNSGRGGSGGGSSSNGNGTGGDTAPGEVLGEQVSIVPAGAPDAGIAPYGANATPYTIPALLALLVGLIGIARSDRMHE